MGKIAQSASNSNAVLADLAEKASRLYRRSNEDWLEAAHAVAEAREVAEHGGWLDFLRDSGIPDRTARRMVQAVRAKVTIGHLADLGQTGIDRILSQ